MLMPDVVVVIGVMAMASRRGEVRPAGGLRRARSGRHAGEGDGEGQERCGKELPKGSHILSSLNRRARHDGGPRRLGFSLSAGAASRSSVVPPSYRRASGPGNQATASINPGRACPAT
jgi:hypothetical protein